MLAAVAGLGWRGVRRYQISQAMATTGPNGIDERRFVKIGGVEQWITIRGQNRDNPAILILHGGPGVAYSALSPHFLPWEHYFTVIQWDQRGAGKSFSEQRMPPTIELMVQDAIEVSEYIRSRLHKNRIILVGHSWGSVLGVYMVKARPDLFDAYVGTGQVVNMQRNEVAAYARVLAKARARRDSNGVASLEKERSAAPTHASRQIGLQRQWATKYEPGEGPMGLIVEIFTSPDYSLKDFGNYFRGVIDGDRFLGKTLDGPFMRVDLPTLGTDFSVPFFIVEGADDDITPAALAKTYFDQITAPRKAFLLMPDAGHAALLTRPNMFLKFLLNDVRPVVSAARR